MKTKVFSHAQVQSILIQLSARQARLKDPHFLAVGIGKASKKGLHDPDRGIVVQYAVRKKLKNPNIRHKIKKHVGVNVKIGGKFRKIILPTDVVAFEKIATSSASVETPTERSSAGFLVSWPVDENTHWGVLTVGHGLNDESAPPIVTYYHKVVGTILHKTSEQDEIDAGLIEIDPQGVQQLFGSSITPNALPIRIRTFKELVAEAQGSHGICTMETANKISPFRLMSFFLGTETKNPLIPELPNLKNIFFGQSDPSIPAFSPGVSGAGWLQIPHIPAAIQVASNSGNFNHGFGLSLESVLAWASSQVGARVDLRAII